MKKFLRFKKNLDLNEENYYIVLKKKYKENPSEYISLNAPLRNKIINFVGSKDKISEREMDDFIFSLSENKDGNFSPESIRNWLRKNKNLVEKLEDKSGNIYYKLTERGRKIYNIFKKFSDV